MKKQKKVKLKNRKRKKIYIETARMELLLSYSVFVVLKNGLSIIIAKNTMIT